MLNEFYDFIAKKINSFFQEISAKGTLLRGESFCLKLDDDHMVDCVTEALRSFTQSNQIMGEYEHCCGDGTIYKTFTIKAMNDEIIIASQINGMTNDFLCATLRNAANDAKKPLLMISANPIDSAKSGSRDMSAYGMPFYTEQLMREIKHMVEESTQLTDTEKRVLHFELERRDTDVFSDKSSLYEYKDLLSIMSSGKIEMSNFHGFRLFAVDGKKDYQNFGSSQIDKEIKNNNSLFEKIDRGIRFGNLEAELSKVFEDGMISKIEKAQKEEPENWSRSFSYSELVAAMEKKQAKTDNPLKIENDNITVYGDLPLNIIGLDDGVLIRNEGSQTAKKRKKNILIFNADHYNKIHLQIECNTRISNNNILKDDSEFLKEGKSVIFEFQRTGVTFHKIEISDSFNGITYVFKICIVDINAKYLVPTVKHCFIVDYKKINKNSRIKLVGIGTNLIFNKDAQDIITLKLEDNEVYNCKYSERLLVYSSEEELANYGSGIKIDVNFSGEVVPFVLFPDEGKSVEITGRQILRDKLARKKSFEYDNEAVLGESQEYFVKANLLRELRVEQQIIEDQICYGISRYFYTLESVEIENIDIQLSPELEFAYKQLLMEYKEQKTIPTLAYLNEKLLVSVENYIAAFEKCFDGLNDGDNLTLEQENALLLGTISVGKNNDEIIFTPFQPLNLKYQIALLNEKDIGNASDVVIDRLNSIHLLPYIQRFKKIYKVSTQLFSHEWKYYAPVENKKYRGSRRYVPKLVEEKITEFISHFKYIFEDINNRTVRINLINMGDCSEVFVGLTQFYIHAINKNTDVDRLMKFELHIYTDDKLGNAFSSLREYGLLKDYLSAQRLSVVNGISMNSLEGILSKNIECYFHKDHGKDYAYCHISFYEMESEITSEQATMNQIETGISIGGIVSGVPSSKYGHKYRTGFGLKYASMQPLVKMAASYNALMQVEASGNPYYSGMGISTQIDERAEKKMEFIYNSSNWVVFIEPKVDLDFFSEKEAHGELIIIHYSDQYTTSSGYDAITVTHKSQQYTLIIQGYLKDKGVNADISDVNSIINLFNAVNGDWLLRLISSKKSNKDSVFSREKISIVAAIKFMLAFLKHKNIIWVPISLEEMLRVSSGAGLSKEEGILSARNLGFDKGPTCDDLLFIGLDLSSDLLKIYLYPTEVKTGNNDNAVIKKAFEQVSATADGLKKAFNADDETLDSIMYKVNRNFLMQILITSCKKMQVYHVDDSQNWDIVLDQCRERLLNEQYTISEEIQEILGKGAVLSFRKALISRRASFKEFMINFIEMPESDEFGIILDEVKNIYVDIHNKRESDLMIFDECDINNHSRKLPTRKTLNTDYADSMDQTDSESSKETSITETDCADSMDQTDQTDLRDPEGPGIMETAVDTAIEQDDKAAETVEIETEKDIPQHEIIDSQQSTAEQQSHTNVEPQQKAAVSTGMDIVFGTNEHDGQPLIWRPNDTTQLFHANTGIIGTMGTGKTQFTKSLIAQLYREQGHNVAGRELGILIFDYKGDYNESKEDFVSVTNAEILKPYHLPFNPLALMKSVVFKPLIPIHTANAFKDTISKVYGLGPKQQDTLFQCIIETYSACGISAADKESWNNEAPTFDQVYQRYSNNESIKKNDSLAAAMNKLHQFEVFEADPSNTKTLFDVLHGVVVIDLSGYDPDIQSLIVAITLDLFYSQMQAAGSSRMEGNYRQLTKLILVDEADNFMSEGFPALKKILKEGREFGVGTILSTQFLKHFGNGEDDYSKYILTWVVHNVADLKKSDIDFVFKTETKSKESQILYKVIKSLAKHHSIVKLGNNKPVYVRDKAFWEFYQELN